MSNQHQNDDVFFKTPRGQPVTLLERRGDKLALYTEDNDVWRRFRKWSWKICEVKYTKGKNLIAVDLYFPSGIKRRLLKALSVPK